MRKVSAAVIVGAMVFGMVEVATSVTITTTTFPVYADSTGGTGEGTPFVVHVSISGWTAMADSSANIRVTTTTGSHFYIWNGSTWRNAYTYTNCPAVTMNSQGDWSGWIYLRVSDATASTFQAKARKVGAKSPLIAETDTHSIAYLNTASGGDGAWVYAIAASATAGKAVLAFDEDGNVIGSYAIENNHVAEGYDSTATGYFKMAVPANTPIAKLQVRNADNSIFDTQTSSQWSSGAAGTETNLDNQEDVSLPVTLTSFTATVGDGEVILRWVTQSELANLGFNIYRAQGEERKDESGEPQDTEYVRINSELIPGAGTSTVRHSYSFIDRGVDNGTTYFYRLEDVSLEGKSTSHGPIRVSLKATEQRKQEEEIPRQLRLEQNFPNPFNPETTIRFAVPLLKDQPVVCLEIYAASGQRVKTLIQKRIEPGLHQLVWNGRDQSGTQVASGVYLCVLKIGGELIEARKMVLIR
ncbi:MAG: hypothetical protein J7J76_01000 [Candidatus Latescibacteria bacterium]|nr:hypothetical protein [Candidatus Latescibacterota bacterium]